MPAKKPPAIVSLQDFDESINILVYGDSGVGKTVFAGSANALILAAEKGTVSAARQGSTADVWPINEWSDLSAAYVWLRENPDHGYDWIVIDSITDAQAKLKDSQLKKAIQARPNHNPDAFELQDYVPYYELYKRTVRLFCELPVNMLFTALPVHNEDEEGDPLVLPDVEGKGYQLSSFTCAQMTAYGYMMIKNRKDNDSGTSRKSRRILWAPEPPYRARDRYDVLGTYTDDMTLAELGKKMNGEPSQNKSTKKGKAA